MVTATAVELTEVESLSTEGAALLSRIGAALEATAGDDLARYLAVRKRLSDVMESAQHAGFPIPPAALAARKVRGELDRMLAQIIAPLETMLR